MSRTVSAWEARRNFGKLLDEVSSKQRIVYIESHGEPKTAMVPVSIAEAIERERQQFFDTMREVSERVGLSEEEAMDIANVEVAAARESRKKQSAR